jgi:predicted ATPase
VATVPVSELIQAAACKTQVIISTQSPTLVNHFTPEDIIVVNREEGASTFRRLSSNELENWLEDYSLGELWVKDVIAGGPRHE